MGPELTLLLTHERVTAIPITAAETRKVDLMLSMNGARCDAESVAVSSIHYPTGVEGSGLKKRYTMVLPSSVRSHQFCFGEGVLLNELEEVTFVDAPWVIDAKRVQSEAISVRS